MTENRELYDWTELIERIQSGDDDAFTVFYERTNRFVRSKIFTFTHVDPYTAEDLSQEIYLYVFRKIGTLQAPNAVLAWLEKVCRGICRRYCLKYSRRMEIAQELSMEDLQEDETALQSACLQTDETRSVQEIIETEELRQTVREQVMSLPEKGRNCMILWMADRPQKEIAERTGLSVGRVKNNLHYARKKMRDNLVRLADSGLIELPYPCRPAVGIRETA